MALAMAMAWRDAALRLLPPVTLRELQTRLRSSNTSGVPGVSCERKQGEAKAWCALLETPERRYRESFPIKTYGEQRAKELAIAARQRMLEQYGVDAFFTVDEQATQQAKQHFAHLLDSPHAQPALDASEIAARIYALNHWLGQLRPKWLYVRMNTYRPSNRRYTANYVRVRSTGGQDRAAIKNFALGTRTYPQRLPEAWRFIETTITAWHGPQRWQSFAKRHEAAFMASNEQDGFRGHDYSAPPGCRTPPASLLPMLAGFELPALPDDWAAVPSVEVDSLTVTGPDPDGA
ncbi:MAG: AP2 domain-containing protein [Pseudomonadales bacterium]|nr:AP2 domain-containing protein [Pseudomonadales bacterium]